MSLSVISLLSLYVTKVSLLCANIHLNHMDDIFFSLFASHLLLFSAFACNSNLFFCPLWCSVHSFSFLLLFHAIPTLPSFPSALFLNSNFLSPPSCLIKYLNLHLLIVFPVRPITYIASSFVFIFLPLLLCFLVFLMFNLVLHSVVQHCVLFLFILY